MGYTGHTQRLVAEPEKSTYQVKIIGDVSNQNPLVFEISKTERRFHQILSNLKYGDGETIETSNGDIVIIPKGSTHIIQFRKKENCNGL